MMFGDLDLELAAQRRREFLREAAEERLARLARPDGTGPEDGVEGVRWGLAADEEAVADLLELNGMPRWVAFEERFVVLERRGRIVGAVRYATESKRLLLGLLVVDPWAGEPRTARALYAGAVALARELGVAEVLAFQQDMDYPAGAGYRRSGRGWRYEVSSGTPRSGWRAVLRLWGSTLIPFHRTRR